MHLIPKEIADQFKFDFYPGTAFFEAESWDDEGQRYKIALALTKSSSGWSTPLYVVLLDVKGQWHLNPWLNDGLIDKIARLAPPSMVFKRIPESSLRQVEEMFGTLEEGIAKKIA